MAARPLERSREEPEDEGADASDIYSGVPALNGPSSPEEEPPKPFLRGTLSFDPTVNSIGERTPPSFRKCVGMCHVPLS